MRKSIVLFGMLSILALTSCDNNKKEENTSSSPPPVEQTVPPAATEQKEGTTIKVNEEGVSYENKDGGNKSNVKISKDSSSIEISRPK